MDEQQWLASRFEEHRPRLRAVAYRMLGSLTEADDAVQDAWERVSRAGAGEVQNLSGWLTTIVARICLNTLRSRNARREEFIEALVPDPIVTADGEASPEDEALMADSVGLALQVVLDTLSPAERLAFVLHDMFDLPFDEIAPMMGRTTQATRQLASRARRRVRGAEIAVPERDLARPARCAPRRRGASCPGERRGGVVITRRGRPFVVMAFTVSDGKIMEIDAIGDRERVGRLAAAVLGESQG